MSQHSRKSLDDDWIVNEPDDGEISWAGESTPSSSQDGSVRLEEPESSPLSSHSRPSKHNTFTTGASIPEFVMPILNTSSTNPFRQRTVPQNQNARTTPVRSSQSRTVSARSTPARNPKPREAPDVAGRVADIAGACIQYGLDILGNALRILKTPISIIFAAYLVLAFFQILSNLITDSIYSALSPVCRIPGVSLLNLPICHIPLSENHPRLPAGPYEAAEPEFDALMTIQGQFETILSDTKAGVSLPMDMKRTEASIRDLKTVVQYSQLPSRHEMLLEFDGFIETARTASYDLMKFNSHVGRGVDVTLSTARWTQRILDDLAHEEEHRGLLPAFISDTILAPFKPLKFTEERLLNQYIEHTHIISGEIEKLIAEAQAVLQLLQNLEDRLDTIHAIAVRDNMKAQGTKDDILAELWTFIGGNKVKLSKVNNQMRLLGQVTHYRKSAFNHVANTVIKLQGMSNELEELRSRVASAETLRDAGVKSIPLSVHIENIQLGVERLSIGRESARASEQQYLRKMLDAADSTEGGVKDIRFLDQN